MIEEGDEPTVPGWITDSFKNGTDEIDMPDSLIVGVEIDSVKGILKKEEAPRGVRLLRGL